MQKYSCHVISNTHWDREWRYPFQAYRMDLVDLIDQLLDTLETRADYRAYFLDSQTVILEDYLEIKPENEERIKKLAEADRLQIGPWYTLPDEWGCPGEALVRNLLVGHQVGRRFGPIAKVGYTPFSNGQVSQLPQLYQGFGIDSCFFYRGIGKHVAKSEFLWDSPDGSRVFGFKFADYARYNYYYLIYRPGLLGRFPKDRDYQWDPEEVPYHVATHQAQDRQYGWLHQKIGVREENLEQATKDCLRSSSEDATTNQLLYMMGHDHSFPLPEEADLVKAANEKAEGQEIFHSTLAEYLDAFRREADGLQLFEGEMRHTCKNGLWTTLMARILSSRLYLKQRNADVNAQVMFGSEPLAAIAWLSGHGYPSRFLEIAWKTILINQAHDAIGGCSVDKVHEEMLTRWNSVETISDEICRRSMREVLRRIDGSRIDPEHLQLTVFNPLPRSRSEIVPFQIDLPHTEEGTPFAVETVDGRPLGVQILRRIDDLPTVEGPYELSMPLHGARHEALLEIDGLPPMGHDALVVKPGKEGHTPEGTLVASDRELENEHLHVAVNGNGTVRLTHKASGRVQEDVCYFEDTAEFGDPWNRVTPDNDEPILSLDRKADISVVSDGPLESTIRASLTLPVPKSKGEGKERSAEKTELEIDLFYTLRKGEEALDVRIEMENTAKDHRLRLMMPSHIENAMYSDADGQFDVLRRTIPLPNATGFKEPPYPTHPMWNFVDVSDGDQGFAVVNNGLIEYEVVDDKPRTVAITLLRAFGKFIFERPTPGSQCLRPLSFHFQLYPHAGDWRSSDLLELKERFCAPIQGMLSAPARGSEPLRRSFLKLEPQAAMFSAVKQGDDPKKLVVRLWNAEEREIEAELSSEMVITRAESLTLEEKLLQPLEVKDLHKVVMRVPGKRIYTVALTFEKELA